MNNRIQIICADCLSLDPNIIREDRGVGPTWKGDSFDIHEDIEIKTECCDSPDIITIDTRYTTVERVISFMQDGGNDVETWIEIEDHIERVSLYSKEGKKLYQDV